MNSIDPTKQKYINTVKEYFPEFSGEVWVQGETSSYGVFSISLLIDGTKALVRIPHSYGVSQNMQYIGIIK